MTYDFTNLYAERVRLYGDGRDGGVTVTATTVQLTRDMSYSNLTMGAGGYIDTRGYRIHVLNVLDLTASASNAIYNNGYVGGNGVVGSGTGAGGLAGLGAVRGTLPGASAGQTGGDGGMFTNPGQNGVAGTHATLGGGGAGGQSGAGTDGQLPS